MEASTEIISEISETNNSHQEKEGVVLSPEQVTQFKRLEALYNYSSGRDCLTQRLFDTFLDTPINIFRDNMESVKDGIDSLIAIREESLKKFGI